MSSYNTDLEEIKSRLDIVDIISEYISLKKTGQNWKGLCPFHSEKTPSFIVSPSKQIYRCFGCGSGGDIFTFLSKHENLSFQESLDILAKKAGVTLKKTRKQAAAAGTKENLHNIYRDASKFYQEKLMQSKSAVSYLESRGIDNKARNLFSIGYAPKRWDELLSYLKKKGYKAETIKTSGLAVHGTKGYYDTFRDRIIFPIFDMRGEGIAFGGRVMDDSMPKYLNSPESPVFSKSRVLYGLSSAKDSIKKKGFAFFVEGYLDVITAHMHGFSNAVAPLGTAITQEHSKLIKRFTQEVIVVFDSDLSGIKAAKSALGILLENGLDAKVLSLPAGEDPDSFLRKRGKDAFTGMLEKSVSFIDFFMMQNDDRRSTCREAVETIARIPDSIVRGDYVKQLSDRTRYNERDIRESLLQIMKKNIPGGKTAGKLSGNSDVQTKFRPKDEVYILQVLLQFPEKSEKIFAAIAEVDFKDPDVRAILNKFKITAVSSQKDRFNFENLISDFDGDAKNLLVELAFKSEFEDPEKVFKDCLNRLKAKKRQILLYDIQDKIKKAEQDKDNILLKSLLLEKQKMLKIKDIV